MTDSAPNPSAFHYVNLYIQKKRHGMSVNDERIVICCKLYIEIILIQNCFIHFTSTKLHIEILDDFTVFKI